MELTPQQLSEVVASLRSETQKAGGPENNKRRFSRMELNAKVEVAAASPEILPKRFSALARDISYGGVGLTQAVPVARGQELVIRLPCGNGGILLVRSAIMHCRVLAYSLFSVGTQFMGEVGLEFLEQLALASEEELKRIRESILA